MPDLSLAQDPSGPSQLVTGSTWGSAAWTVGGARLDFATASGDGRSTSSLGVSRIGDDWRMRIGFTGLADTRTTLGGSLQRRFGATDGVRLSAATIEGARALGRWTLSGSFEAGSAQAPGVGVRGVATSAWRASAQTDFAGGGLRFSLAQPRRAETGEISFEAPIAVLKTGALVRELRTVALTPSGRQIDVEADWRRPLDAWTEIEATAALISQPNHVADAPNATAVWIALRHIW